MRASRTSRAASLTSLSTPRPIATGFRPLQEIWPRIDSRKIRTQGLAGQAGGRIQDGMLIGMGHWKRCGQQSASMGCMLRCSPVESEFWTRVRSSLLLCLSSSVQFDSGYSSCLSRLVAPERYVYALWGILVFVMHIPRAVFKQGQ